MSQINNPGLSLTRSLKRGVVVLPGAYDALSALLIQKNGFKAAYLSGAGLSVGRLGKPDIGLLTLDEVAGQARAIARAIDIPLVVDADTGFGGEWNVERAVQEIEGAGAAGIQIEDQKFPKRCGHLDGKSLISADEMAIKIRRAVRSRRSPQFMIVARTDARSVTGVKDALRRALAYKKAGADVIFPEALESESEFKIFGRKKNLGTLMANMTEFGRSPALTVKQLAHLGYRLVLYPMTAFRMAAFAMDSTLHHLFEKGETRSLLNRMQTRRELYKLNRYDDFNRRESKWKNSRKK